jgi:two-component system, LytTR family, sensor kinase
VNQVTVTRPQTSSALVWAISLAVWTFISLAASITIYGMYHLGNGQMRFGEVASVQFSHLLTYFPLTPFAFAFACRFPFQRDNWVQRSLQLLAGGLVFTLAHILLKSLTPYGYWDRDYHEWSSAIWNSQHEFRPPWAVFKQMFLLSVVDDVASAYLPIVIVAHAVSYYRSFREREVRASQLESQLSKARLQTLKAQLQPHFLFNTMHSISALMLTDIQAADRMMTRLSDLLRLSFANSGVQMTTLGHEIEFVNGYLEIEKTRFEDRLRVLLDIAPDCLDAMVPHLLLQPLVENAVKHGVSRRSSGGEIHIVARREMRDLHLDVRDNGPGLTAAFEEQSKTGVGLKITRDRLTTLYGLHASCEIRNLADGGAEADLRIPFRVAKDSSRADEETTANNRSSLASQL